MYLGEQRDSWFFTSFHLEAAGKPIDETIPLKDVSDLKDGSSISVVEGSFFRLYHFIAIDIALFFRPMRVSTQTSPCGFSVCGVFFEILPTAFCSCAVDKRTHFTVIPFQLFSRSIFLHLWFEILIVMRK